jgi:hypothetical protein
LGESSERGVADCCKECLAVGEMPVGGIGDDPDHARHLAQDDGVRSTYARKRDASLNERGPDRPAGPRPATHRLMIRHSAQL